MFRHSKLPWSLLLQVGIKLVLWRYGITEGVLAGDDSDRQRAKVTKRIFAAHKVFDKKTGGYFNGQTVVLLLLVTSKVSLPVGFRFYQPDPAVVQWKKTDDALKQQGVRKSERPPKPARNPAYPSKPDLLLDLLREFRFHHPQIQIKAILADALYGSARFMNQVAEIFADVQTVSQLQKTQIVRFRNRDLSVGCSTPFFSKIINKITINN
jgi:hypothetical protein